MSIQFSGLSAFSTAYASRPQQTKEQLTETASNLFSKLDSQNKGYLEKSDFSGLLSGLQDEETSAKSEELFSSLDSDNDGQLTSTEFSDSFSQLLYSAQGTMVGIANRPAPPQDSGKSKDELTTLLEELEQEDEGTNEGLQSLLDNFDTADADGDGKVTMQEAMAYKQSAEETSTANSAKEMTPPPGGMGGSQKGSGVTAEELTALLESTDDTDPDVATNIQSLLDNFDSADSDGDGRVTRQEANRFKEEQQSDSPSVASNSSNNSDDKSISQLLSRTMQQLMDSYGGQGKANTPAGSRVNISA